MSEAPKDAGSESRLREGMDDLMTRSMVSGIDSIQSKDLTLLSNDAGDIGFTETASAAAELALNISAKPDGAGRTKTVTEGLVKLQKIFDRESEPAEQAPAETKSPSVPQQAPASYSFAQDRELMNDFVVESREHLSSIEGQMLVLEQEPESPEVINSVFRAFHTIKGLAGFMEFASIQALSHQVETLLDLARNAKLAITGSVVDVVLESADYLKGEIDSIEDSLQGREPGPAVSAQSLLARIASIIAGEHEEPSVLPSPEPVGAAGTSAEAVVGVEAPRAGPSEPPGQPAGTDARAQRGQTPNSKAPDTFSIRVETTKLDHLMDMVGEMVVAQSIIRHNLGMTVTQDSRLLGDLSQLTRITTEVQRTAMGMRMVSIGQLFQRTARMVRDLSRKSGKPVVLETSGEETEVDKTIAEELSDPLLHMVRNSLDHGIEPPAMRAAAGKNPTATIRLAAYHQAGQIVVEISDDGRGLDREKILSKARQNGMVENGSQLSNGEVFHLIFQAGFSTAEKVTDISGRGVGMDVVRKHVEKLRGRIDVRSVAGQGATFTLTLPLTLAIIEGLVVVVGKDRYIVPIFAVREMFRPAPEILSTLHDRDEMVLVRGRLLPIIRLHRRLGLTPRTEELCQGLLIVAECGNGKEFCIFVDDLIGKQEVVIKNLGETFKDISGLAGCAILGDGRVGLILDMEGIYRGNTV